MYKITSYTYQKARELGVEVRPSINPNKKIDVFKDGKKIASIGDPNYLDFPTYTKEKGQAYANERRRLYHIRHAKDKNIEGLLSKALLW
jgi:hypothetical protein